MPWILAVALVIVAAVVMLAALKGKEAAGTIDVPYLPSGPLFTPAERSFLGVLDQAVGTDHRVFGKVRLADLAKLKSGLGNAARQGALNRIASKHLDFVVCRTSDLDVVCAVELNDKSHSSQRTQTRDEFLTRVCRIIDLPLIQVTAQKAYSVSEIRSQFTAAIAPPLRVQAKG